jgi:hypothetical protein
MVEKANVQAALHMGFDYWKPRIIRESGMTNEEVNKAAYAKAQEFNRVVNDVGEGEPGDWAVLGRIQSPRTRR